jgi:hypothetical protein
MRQNELDVAAGADCECDVGLPRFQKICQPQHIAAVPAAKRHALDARFDEIAVMRRVEIDNERDTLSGAIQPRGEQRRHAFRSSADQPGYVHRDMPLAQFRLRRRSRRLIGQSPRSRKHTHVHVRGPELTR